VLSLQLRLFLLALRTYSRIPAPGAPTRWAAEPGEQPGRAIRYFPLVGLVVAALTAIAYAIFGLWLPHAVSLLLAMGTGQLLTGAMHELGFARFCDGFRDGSDGAAARAGLAGTLGTVMMLLLRLEVLTSIDPSWIGVTLVTAAAFSRGCAVMVSASPAPGPAGGGAPPAARLASADTRVALALAALPSLAAAWWTASVGVFASAAGLALACTVAMRALARRRGAACSEDSLGAVQQCVELAFYLGVLATLSIVDEETLDAAS
jgi:adenosylcobinamide-GDP ribazoletransferase